MLDQIEDDFKEFMLRENLRIDAVDKKIFHDIKYGIDYLHDIEEDFDKEYDKIHEKYMRRVNVFREMIMHPTVFFRCIKDNEEVEYINDNWKHIDELLKRFNPENQIVYVCHSGIKGLTDKVKLFVLNFDCYIGKVYEMRHMFDGCPDLITFCDLLIEPNKMQKNIAFDNRVNSGKELWAYINECVKKNADDLEMDILKTLDATASEGIYLWGAGQCGVLLARYLRDRNVTIRAIVDNQKAGEVCERIQIKAPDCIEKGAKVLISVVEKEANDSIERQINSMDIRMQVAKLGELKNKLAIINN